jgi:hypothetical protein
MQAKAQTRQEQLASDRLERLLAGLSEGPRWLLPLGLFGLVLLYELGPARWTLAAWGSTAHIAVDIAVYGILGPLLGAIALALWGRWREERETTTTQSLVLARERAQAEARRNQSDDSLQALFAASAMMAALEDHAEELPAGASSQLHAARAALETAIQTMYVGLKR